MDGRVAGGDASLPLDSILAYAVLVRSHPDQYFSGTIATLAQERHFPHPSTRLPLAQRGTGPDWYWACSANVIDPVQTYVRYWHKRFDDQWEQWIDWRGRRGKISTKSGSYKSMRMPLVIQLFPYLEWYAVGDRDQVDRLCQQITHVGKKTSQGFGAVRAWTVEPWPMDASIWHDGRLMRPIPASEPISREDAGTRVASGRQGIRPPYWHPSTQRLCWIPPR